MASDLPSSSDDLITMQIGEWKGVEFVESEEELYDICRAECGDGECQLAVGNGGQCPMRAADDFEAIRERMEELRQGQDEPHTCPLTLKDCVQACAVDDHGMIFCKKEADGGQRI